MKTQLLSAAAVAAFAFSAVQAAHAQSIDYGSLQQLFNEPVTTSATGSPQRSSEAPVPMDIISQEDIKRSGATDLPTILSRVAGIDILQWGAQSADVGVRGYDEPYSPRLLVLINGRQVYLDHYGYTAWASLPVQLDEIRQIEVVKGPNSALFGFNAASGVVNIITYNPKYDDVNTATVRGGTQNDVQGDIVKTFRLGDRFSARASVGAERSDEWKNGADGPDPGAGPRPSRVEANLDTITKLSEKSELRVEGSWSNSQINEFSPSGTYAYTKYITDSFKGTFAADTNLGQAQL